MTAALLGTILLGATAAISPAHDYVLHCAGCHRFDGTGSESVPALSETARLADCPGGREYLLRVPGVAQAALDDARLAALLGWVVETFGSAAIDPEFTADEAGRHRRHPLRDPLATRDLLGGCAR